jgi:hypothetical protein
MVDVPERLAQLLETLTSEERREITAWFLGTRGPATGMHWLAGPELRRSGVGVTSELRSGRLPFANTLSAGEESQLVTIRLPADRHAELRAWCSDHGFTMAAVVRGLIERFLDEQGKTGDPGKTNDPGEPAP